MFWVLLLLLFSLGLKTAQEVHRSPFECCSRRQDDNDLLECVQQGNQSQDTPLPPTTKVLVVTYLTSGQGQYGIRDILKFGVYQLAVMQAYSRVKGYLFEPTIRELVDVAEGSIDERWTKIDILRNITNDERYNQVELILWMDADAMIIDFHNFDVQKLAAEAPNADILASADIRQGYINTGVLLIRNNAWSGWFLHEWWNRHDREALCDQDAFDLLYTNYINSNTVDTLNREEKLSKVKIFPPSVLNSDPPAMKFQLDTDPILHLMGEATELRAAVFQAAYDNVCSALSIASNKNEIDDATGEKSTVYEFPKQLNQSRENLVAHAERVYSQLSNQLYFTIDSENSIFKEKMSHFSSVDEFLSEPETKNFISAENTLNQFDEVSVYYHHLCDVISIIYKDQLSVRRERHQRIRIKAMELVKSRLSSVKQLQTELNRVKKNNHGEVSGAISYLKIMLMKRAAEAGNDLYHAHSAVDKKTEVAEYVLSTLKELYDLVATQSKPQILHMVALMHLSLSHLDMSIAQSKGGLIADGGVTTGRIPDTSNIMNALDHVSTSIGIFDTHLSSAPYTKENPAVEREHLEALELHAMLLCSIGRYHDSTRAWEKAVDKANHNLRGVDLGLAFREYVHVNYNYVICTHRAISSSVITCTSSIFHNTTHLLLSTEQSYERLSRDDQSKESLILLQRVPDFRNMAKDIRRYLKQCIGEGSDGDDNIYNFTNQGNDMLKTSDVEREIFPDEEWEDCVEGEPDCEAFVIDEIRKVIVSREGIKKEANEDEEDEEEEYRQIRLQYMQQTLNNQDMIFPVYEDEYERIAPSNNQDASPTGEGKNEMIAMLLQKIEEQQLKLEADKLELERLQKSAVS